MANAVYVFWLLCRVGVLASACYVWWMWGGDDG